MRVSTMLDEALLTYPELFLWLSYHMKSTHWTQPLHPLSKSDLIMTFSLPSPPCTWVMTTALYPWVLRSVTSSSMALLYALRYSSTVWKPPLGSSFAFWSPNQQWPQGIMDWPQVSPSTAALSGSLGANYRDRVTLGQSITSCVMSPWLRCCWARGTREHQRCDPQGSHPSHWRPWPASGGPWSSHPWSPGVITSHSQH